MKELKIIDQNGRLLVDSREVAEMTSIRHGDLLEKIRNYIKYLTNGEFRSLDFFIESKYIDSKGEDRTHYFLTKKGCDMIANKMTGEKGVLFTATYIDTFYEYEEALKSQSQPSLPQTYKEALVALLEKVEENEKLTIENQTLKPKGEYFDALVEKNLLTNFRDTAKEFKLKQNAFINWLLERGYVYRDAKGKLKPHAQHTPDLFEIKESKNENWVGTQTLITPRGRETFRLLITSIK